MIIKNDHFSRQEALFGAKGQEKLRACGVAFVGYGGLGTQVAQQLAHLGVGRISIIEPEIFDESNRNRYVGSHSTDVGRPKIEIAKRVVEAIDPNIKIKLIYFPLESAEAFDAIKNADVVFGCLDHDGPRFILNELCIAYRKPLIDLASDILEGGVYGGRVALVRNGNGCLYCMKVLDDRDVTDYISSPEQRENIRAVYGIEAKYLNEGVGPSVVSINGTVASLGVTEFMVMITGMREPYRLLNYYGHEAKIRHSSDGSPNECPYCANYGHVEKADVERYLK